MGAREDVCALRRVLPGRGTGERLWGSMQQEGDAVVGSECSPVHQTSWATVRVTESVLRSIHAAIFARFRK